MQVLKRAEVVESMVEHVRKNLVLDKLNMRSAKPRMTFTGMGIKESDEGIHFALEIITNIAYSDRALPETSIKNLVEKRTASHYRKDRTYTAIIFPKSLDYSSASARFECPYFRQASLLKTAKNDRELFDGYAEFNFNDVKELSRVEWEIALPLCAHQIAYYNAAKHKIQIHKFQSFPSSQIIPENIPLEKGYFWDFARAGYFPPESDSRKAAVFRGMQEGLHDRVKKLIGKTEISKAFTLKHRDSGGADLVECVYQGELFLK